MQNETYLSDVLNEQSVLHLLWDEVRITWLFTYYNLSTATIPGVLFTLVAFYASGRPLAHLPHILLLSVTYFWLYIYVFDVLNQIQGIEEDQINKPTRPIVAGLVTKEGAWVRFSVGTLLYTTLAWMLGVIGWAIAWQGMAIFLNLGGSKHWFWKNLLMATGGVAQLAAAWQMVQPLTPTVMLYIVLTTMPICLIVSLQDLRDVEGDLRVDRRTFPIAFGDTFTRWEVALSQMAYPPLALAVLWVAIGLTPAVLATVVVSAIASGIVAVRILLFRNPRADHITYMCFTYWYCFVVVSGAFVLT